MNSSPRLWKILALALAVCLLLTVPSRADTYAQWAARVFSAQEQSDPTISGEDAAPAGDGVSNLLKFAFDLDPHQSGVAGLPTVSTVLDPWANVVGYFGYQEPQKPGGSYRYVYKALSPVSQNPAGLFMHLRVIEGNQPPADWQMQYFGHTGIDPNADADGDGISNWQEYLNGTDPTDFYNGSLPTIALLGGGNQRGSPGTVLPRPITVVVNSSGVYNAPLTFAVTSGNALLAAGTGSGHTPAASVQMRSVSPFLDAHGNRTYAAQAYVYLPATGNNVSTITVTATSGTQTATLSTQPLPATPTCSRRAPSRQLEPRPPPSSWRGSPPISRYPPTRKSATTTASLGAVWPASRRV